MMVGGLCPSPLAGPLLDRTSSSRRFRIVTTAAVGNGKKFSNRVDSFQDYYDVLGISVNASPGEIRKAYRSLQKKHHPDVAGAKGHAMTLLLNEAYQTLMSEELRDIYDSMHLKKSMRFSNTPSSFTGLAYSSWNGPDRDEAVFVDENACVGCPECVFLASKTFAKDESSGRARVCTQWGDEDTQIKAAFEACPVNCIHYVEKCDLPILEYLMRPRPKASNGIFGGEWERPSNIFMAAKTFKLKLEAEEQSRKSNVPDWKTETVAQRKARKDADLKIRAGIFWRLWSWVSDDFGYGSDHANGKRQEPPAETWPWKGLFGRSSTSQLLQLPVDSAQVPQVVERVQDWATTFASSSELPLPMPFRTDLLENGVHLTLLTVNNGVLKSVGSLIVTVDQIPSTREDPVIDIGKDEEPKWWCCIERQGTTGTQSLPGEAVIVRRVRDVVKGTDKSYSNYRIRRS